jgi:hypothetical protein
MHLPPQLISLPGHDTAHAPFAQTFPFAHSVPGVPPSSTPHSSLAPQFERLDKGSMHVPPQFTSLPGHDTAHDPFAHTLPFTQTIPALPPSPPPQPSVAPQLVMLFCGSMQVPLQFTSPAKHEIPHDPSTQTVPLEQLTPTLPASLPHPNVAPQ